MTRIVSPPVAGRRHKAPSLVVKPAVKAGATCQRAERVVAARPRGRDRAEAVGRSNERRGSGQALGTSRRIVAALGACAAAVRATLAEWRRRYWSRRILEEMNMAMLQDIGLSPGDALHEARKPFWRP